MAAGTVNCGGGGVSGSAISIKIKSIIATGNYTPGTGCKGFYAALAGAGKGAGAIAAYASPNGGNITVTPYIPHVAGRSYPVSIGAGGAIGTVSSPGGDGGATTFGSAATVGPYTATGGTGYNASTGNALWGGLGQTEKRYCGSLSDTDTGMLAGTTGGLGAPSENTGAGGSGGQGSTTAARVGAKGYIEVIEIY